MNDPTVRTLIILPTYNESLNLRLLIEALLALDTPLDILVVDDNSPDGTGELANEMARNDARVHAIHRAGKMGLGTAYVAGFRYGLARGYARLMTMDCDFSHDPAYVPAMVSRSAQADLVIGSRYVPGGAVKGWGITRRLISATANLTARLMLGLRTRDCSAGFRCYRPEAISAMGLDRIASAGYSALEEITFRAERSGISVAEVPIIFRDRTRGDTKMAPREILGGILTLFRLWLHGLRMRK